MDSMIKRITLVPSSEPMLKGLDGDLFYFVETKNDNHILLSVGLDESEDLIVVAHHNDSVSQDEVNSVLDEFEPFILAEIEQAVEKLGVEV